MKNGRCCPNSQDVKAYTVDLTSTLTQDAYTLAILRSDIKKQIVVTLTGTKKKTTTCKGRIFFKPRPFWRSK